MSLAQELHRKFAILDLVEIIPGQSGLPAIRITGKHTGEIYLHGAHITKWKPAGHSEVLWLSAKSIWENSKPIRGGVPICFPWFGPNKADPSAPAHGFARLKQWDIESIDQSGDDITVTLLLQSDDSTLKLWPHSFTLRHRVTFGKELIMSLELTNTGTEPFHAEEALHTYFSVSDAKQARVLGLENTRYIDKTDAMKEKTQDGPITISAETDRVYLNTTAPAIIEDPAAKRKITIAKEGSENTVVWNPWIAKAKAMPDFGDEEWPHMLCVETCNVAGAALHLTPGSTHSLVARITLSQLS